jgi:hypothetical protein
MSSGSRFLHDNPLLEEEAPTEEILNRSIMPRSDDTSSMHILYTMQEIDCIRDIDIYTYTYTGFPKC